MLRLRTLGGLAVERDGEVATGAAAQRRRLAVLALLASAGSRGLSRDKILGFLWPEADTDKARHALRLALSALRRDLRYDLFLEANELRLNPNVIVSDVSEFEASAAAGNYADAVRLYAGAFLDGFYVSDAPDFERWVESERARLAHIAKHALETLAEQAASNGDRRAAVDHWRRLAALDPLNSRVIVELMRALVGAGDRAGALQVARDHEVLLRRELQAGPDPAVSGLAAVLREQMSTDVPSGLGIPAIEAIVPSTGEKSTDHTADPALGHRGFRKGIVAGLVVTALVVGGWNVWVRRDAATASASSAIAVLPFVDLSPNRDHEYFSDGIAEELTHVLTHVEGLRVVSQTSTFALKGKKLDVREIGQKLNASTVLEGSVRRTENRVRITAQLIDARSGYHRWSKVYDVDAKDVLSVQQEIARAIASGLQLHLSDAAARPLTRLATNNVEAYNLYLKGRYYWNRRTPVAVRTAIRHFEEAIARDPSYARAYVGLADAYVTMVNAYGEHLLRPRAMAAALRAFAMDSTLGEAVASIAEMKADDWHWAEAERGLRRAIELTPGYARAHSLYGSLLAATGRPAEAIKHYRIAHELDPLSLPIENALASQLFRIGEDAEAFRRWRAVLEIDPNFLPARRRLAMAHLARGRTAEALAEYRRLLATPGATTRERALLGHAYAVSGRSREARQIVLELDSLSKQEYVSPYHVAAIFAGLGDSVRALDYLEKAYEEHDPFLANIVSDSLFTSIAASPRLIRLRARMGL